MVTSKGENRVSLGEAPLLLRKQLFQSNNSGCSWQATRVGGAGGGVGGEWEGGAEPPWERLGIAGLRPWPGTPCSGRTRDTEAEEVKGHMNFSGQTTYFSPATPHCGFLCHLPLN